MAAPSPVHCPPSPSNLSIRSQAQVSTGVLPHVDKGFKSITQDRHAFDNRNSAVPRTPRSPTTPMMRTVAQQNLKRCPLTPGYALPAPVQPITITEICTSTVPFPEPPPSTVYFYHKDQPHYGFTNFSSHTVQYEGKTYATSEHLFQCLKFLDHRPDIAERIFVCSRSAEALSEAQRFRAHQRSDWFRVNIQMMDKVIYHKFTQHEELKAELLGTGDTELVEDSDRDSFWGIGKDKKGRNELGKALQRLRDRLRRGVEEDEGGNPLD